MSHQLAAIKKKHDEAKEKVKQAEKTCDALKKDIEQATIQEQQAEGPVDEINHRIEHLNNALAETRQKIAEETMCKHSYMHMLSRMKKDFIASKIKCTELDESLKSKRQLLDLEQSKQRKTKEERLQSKAIFDNLMKNIEKEQRDRQERILELNKCITNKEASVNRRIERQRKNQEIAETAASENKDSSELKWRQKLMINKLWNTFMRKKMEKEMRNSQAIDEAFKQIKTATSITDVDALVKRFLQRETTYSQLLNTVNESDSKIEKLKRVNEELCNRLHELQTDASDTNPSQGDVMVDNHIEAQHDQSHDCSIADLKKNMGDNQRSLAQLNERFKKINIVNDQVKTWCHRIWSKFGTLTEDEMFRQECNDTLTTFQCMDKIITKELTDNRDQYELWKKFIEAAHTANRFNNTGTDSLYANTNVRIRPVSGLTHADGDGRMSNISKG